MKKGLAICIIALLFATSLTPLVFAYAQDVDLNDDIKSSYQSNLDLYYYDEYSSVIREDEYCETGLVSYSYDVDTFVNLPNPIFDGPMDSPWSMQSHDSHHTGRSQFATSGNPDGLEKWRYHFTGWVEDNPVIDNNGTIYCKGTYDYLDRYLYAFYQNGTEKWKFKTDGLILGSSPAIDEDGIIYLGCWDNCLYAINPNGTLKWRFPTSSDIASSPAIGINGTIFFGNYDAKFYAVNPDGTEKWHYNLDGDTTCDPVIGDDGSIYIGSFDDYFYAFNPNGTLKWRFKTGHYIKGPASIAPDGTIYVGSYDDYLYALNPDGTEKWKAGVGHGTETNPTIGSDGTIYVGGDRLYAIYPNSTRKWALDLGIDRHIHMSSPAISADGIIYVGVNIGDDEGGEIIAVNEEGTERWRKRLTDNWVDSSPSIGADGTVYIGSSDEMSSGYLHAFGNIESNIPPNTPSIDGPLEGQVGEEQEYIFCSIDPDLNPVSFFIDWDDGTTSTWSRDYASGENVRITHTWEEQGTYTIGVKARDTLGEESNWAYLEVIMPVNQQSYELPFFVWFSERFPIIYKILSSFLEAII